MKKLFAILLALVLALSLAACGARQTEVTGAVSPVKVSDGDTLGQGKTTFRVTITNIDGESITITVHTDEETVGEALQKLGVIEGEEGDYGIYIKSVNQETHDYDKDGTYWSFYVDGEYAAAGADMTAIDPAVTYAFVAEKG